MPEDEAFASHSRRVSAMFGRIAGPYDLLNHVLSLGLDRRWRAKLADLVSIGPTGRVLDLAAGTMDVSLALRKRHPEARVAALDFSLPMLTRGAAKASGRGVSGIQPVLADGRFLPLAGESVDCVTIAFGIRNIKPRQDAYREILRVLAPGGRLAILEFGTARRRVWKGLYNFYLRRLLPAVGGAVSGDAEAYRYLADTVSDFPNAEELAAELREAGFEDVDYRPLTSGIVYLHKGDKPKGSGQGR